MNLLSLCSAMLLISQAKFGITIRISTACQIDNSTCVDKVMNSIFMEVVRGNPTLNISKCDPLKVPVMTREIAMYGYNKTNSTFRGFKGCSISNVKISSNWYMMSFILTCPRYNVAGNVDVEGYLLHQYVFGSGTYNITCGPCNVHTYTKLEQVNRDNGEYFQMGQFSLYVLQQPSCTFEFSGLYNGNKTKTEAAATFATENALEVMSFENLEYMFKPAMSTIFKEINKILLTISINKLFTP